MFRLIRGLVGMMVVLGLVYVAVTVPLGEKTLWQHLKAIAGSPQSEELVKEVKKTADKVLDRKGASSMPAGQPKGAKDDGFTPQERQKLRELIKEKMNAPAKSPPPKSRSPQSRSPKSPPPKAGRS